MNRYNIVMFYQKIRDSLCNIRKTLVKQKRLKQIESEDNFLLIFRNHTFFERLQSLFTPPTNIFSFNGGGSIFLGNCTNAGDKYFMIQENICLIVNASKEVPDHFHDHTDLKIKYYRVHAHDISEDASSIVVPDIVKSIIDHLRIGDNVFIHCFMGRSRSVAVCLQVIREITGKPLETLYLEIKQKRPIIHINTSFFNSLKEYYRIRDKKVL